MSKTPRFDVECERFLREMPEIYEDLKRKISREDVEKWTELLKHVYVMKYEERVPKWYLEHQDEWEELKKLYSRIKELASRLGVKEEVIVCFIRQLQSEYLGRKNMHPLKTHIIKYRIEEERKLVEKGVLKPKPAPTEEIKPPPPKPEHEQLVELICEIGGILGYEAEREYTYGSMRFDVVWSRKPRVVPTHVFEVQLKGNLHQALIKLKHANDIWGSKPILVVSEDNIRKAMKIVEGSFHEIKLIDSETLKEYYDFLKKYLEIHKELETPP